MERIPKSEENCKAVELAIMVEAGSIVREMGNCHKALDGTESGEMIFICYHVTTHPSVSPQHVLQDRKDLNYNDPVAVAVEIPPTWWLDHTSCNYIFLCTRIIRIS